MEPERSGPADVAPGRADGRYQALFEWSAAGTAMTSLDGRFLAANPTLCRMLGYTEDELCELDFRAVTHPDDRAANDRLHEQLLAGELPSFVLEKRYLASDGTVVWGRVSAALIRDATGTPLYVATTVEDITSHKLANEQLELSQSLLRIAGRKARIGGWAIEQPSQETFWSDEMFEILDVPSGDVPPLIDAYAMYPPADRERIEAAIAACASEGTPFDLVVELTTFTGRALWVRVAGEAERAADGTIIRLTGAFQDISELMAARAKTEEVTERLATSLESMTDAVCLLDRDWRFTYLNPRAEQLLRRDRDELLGRELWEAFPEAVETPVHEALTRAVSEGSPIALEELYYPALDTWFTINGYPSPQGLAVYFRDVTEQHHARVALEQRERKLAEQAALLDETQEAIFVQDLEGLITYWNRSAKRIYGASSEDAVGRPAAALAAGDADLHAEAMRTTLADGAWSGELRHLTDDGRDLIIQSRWTQLRDAAGAPRSILVTDTDVTEGRRMEQQLIRSQRLESIGTLAGGIAHDLNNVLAPILLAIELLSKGEDDRLKLDILRTIEDSAQRGARMVRQVLSFARGVDGDRVELDVTRLITDVLRIAAETFPRDIRLLTEFSATSGRVRGDETQLHQVLMNLLVNARDAMPAGGTIICSTDDHVVDGRGAAGTPGVPPGRYVVVQVTDDGHGMSRAVADRIFEPFFTTKRQGEGTGLGLPTSLAIVASHGGQLLVQSEPGRGTTFQVYLPTPGVSERSSVSVPAKDPPRGNGELVLVVDDEASIRTLMQQTLRTAGYRVMTARDGAEAVAIYRRQRDDIALVITDLMMPVMGGSAAIEALRTIDPAVHVIASSGLVEPLRDGVGADGLEHLLPKPFTTEQLLRLTAAALTDDA
jgi:two-component system, cell cycle sensor histidine kinase and response regulator CckA